MKYFLSQRDEHHYQEFRTNDREQVMNVITGWTIDYSPTKEIILETDDWILEQYVTLYLENWRKQHEL